ncbi:MAG: hypothetical protein H6604_08770 [Flavobacteriales bacterium]|nr:hypothetical protein [Flavobacteriales bacterium]
MMKSLIFLFILLLISCSSQWNTYSNDVFEIEYPKNYVVDSIRGQYLIRHKDSTNLKSINQKLTIIQFKQNDSIDLNYLLDNSFLPYLQVSKKEVIDNYVSLEGIFKYQKENYKMNVRYFLQNPTSLYNVTYSVKENEEYDNKKVNKMVNSFKLK